MNFYHIIEYTNDWVNNKQLLIRFQRVENYWIELIIILIIILIHWLIQFVILNEKTVFKMFFTNTIKCGNPFNVLVYKNTYKII